MHDSLLSEKINTSLECCDGNVNSMEDIHSWIADKRQNTKVIIREASLNEDTFWFYDDQHGEILNRKRSFFSILGLRHFINNKFICEQPIILQNEVGFLGIIAKEINGVLNFLMQAKIEPGNINFVQISPTIQATKSNFTRAHGGHLPHYYEFFENAASNGKIIYDQFQSEQGNRFWGKKNRNIIVLIEDDIEVYPDYMWMTLGQIKKLLLEDNTINMDSRTVLSGIPFAERDSRISREEVQYAYHVLNTFRMYNSVNNVQIPLNQLTEWNVEPNGVFCSHDADFEVKYFDIHIQGREVQDWTQPLFCATSRALFVLFVRNHSGRREYLIHVQSELGCSDHVEFGPSIQLSNHSGMNSEDVLIDCFKKHTTNQEGIECDVLLSEEGGRFYREENRNVIIEVGNDEIISPLIASPGDALDNNTEYLWVSYDVLMRLMDGGHSLNIQLRSMMSLLNKF